MSGTEAPAVAFWSTCDAAAVSPAAEASIVPLTASASSACRAPKKRHENAGIPNSVSNHAPSAKRFAWLGRRSAGDSR